MKYIVLNFLLACLNNFDFLEKYQTRSIQTVAKIEQGNQS